MAGCKVIGILGGVGSGKSEATAYLESEYKAYALKADELAHRLYRKGQPGYKAVLRICGKTVLDTDKQIDRRKLASLLYQNPDLLSQINNSIHPMVYKNTSQMIYEYKKRHLNGLVVYEAAIIPSKKENFIDEIWYIYTPEEIRIQRLKDTRGYSDSRIKEIMNSQPDETEYKAVSDRIIINDSSLDKLKEQIDEIIKHSERQQR